MKCCKVAVLNLCLEICVAIFSCSLSETMVAFDYTQCSCEIGGSSATSGLFQTSWSQTDLIRSLPWSWNFTEGTSSFISRLSSGWRMPRRRVRQSLHQLISLGALTRGLWSQAGHLKKTADSTSPTAQPENNKISSRISSRFNLCMPWQIHQMQNLFCSFYAFLTLVVCSDMSYYLFLFISVSTAFILPINDLLPKTTFLYTMGK
jgi:hypothetical protein